jgi:hypothetical protein
MIECDNTPGEGPSIFSAEGIFLHKIKLGGIGHDRFRKPIVAFLNCSGIIVSLQQNGTDGHSLPNKGQGKKQKQLTRAACCTHYLERIRLNESESNSLGANWNLGRQWVCDGIGGGVDALEK